MERRREQDNLVGSSPVMSEVLEQVSGLAALNRPVLLVGERGTGKELIAARLHYLSPRWDEPYVKLNCASLPETLLESELFGHEAGAFTDAKGLRKGRFESADGGTLFLDELSCAPLTTQEKILRVIEYGEFERVGGSRPINVDVRIVAATNEDLPSLVGEGRFRADLLDRLAFDVITLPALRHRREDIMELAEHFAARMAVEIGLDVFPGFTDSATEKLLAYDWPGNVRELKNVVERAIYRNAESDGAVDEIVFDPFASPFRPRPTVAERTQSAGPLDFKEVVRSYEIELLERGMEATRFNQRKAAEYLGLTYHQLRGYLRKYELLN